MTPTATAQPRTAHGRHRKVAAGAALVLLAACGREAPIERTAATEPVKVSTTTASSTSTTTSTSTSTTLAPTTPPPPPPSSTTTPPLPPTTTSPPPPPTTTIQSGSVDQPIAVSIPAIGVDSTLVPLILLPDGSLEAPEDFDVAGWYQAGPEPGEPGASVIAGHVDSRTGPAVFYRLRDLDAGDQIAVNGAGGEAVAFVVERVEQYPKDDFPADQVYAETELPVLRLITCGGTFDRDARSYRDNIVVFARLA